MDDNEGREALRGLRGILLVSLSYYTFLLTVMLGKWELQIPVLCNRALCLIVFATLHYRLRRGLVSPRSCNSLAFLVGLSGLISLSHSYVCGAVSHISIRIGLLIYFSSVSGLRRGYCAVYHGLCLVTCALLQTRFPCATDPVLNLAVPAISTILGWSVFEARLQTAQLIGDSHRRLKNLGEELQETLARAQASKANLDKDVEAATSNLALTNVRLQQTIDLQIGAFAANQALQRRLSEDSDFRALGRAAGFAAHDFNNLLSVIACSIELLEEELLATPDSPAQVRDSQTIAILSGELRRASKVGRDILALSGKQVVHAKTFRLLDWLQESCRCEKPGIHVRLDLGGLPPELPLWGDMRQLRQILNNLISNAVESMTNGGIIQVEVTQDQKTLIVNVKDEGEGVALAIRPLLFQPFLSTKDHMLHSGLGLASARAMARQLGGELTFCDLPRKSGASFCLRLPIIGDQNARL